MVILSILSLLKYNNYVVFAVIVLLLVLIDSAVYIALRLNRSKLLKTNLAAIHIIISVITYVSAFFVFFIFKYNRNPYDFSWIYDYSATLFSWYSGKAIFLIFSFMFIWLRLIKSNIYDLVTITISIVVFLSLMYGMFWGRFHFEKTSVTLNINEFPKNLKGLKIVQISDLHFGAYIGHEQEFQRVVDSINTENADLVFLTGDFVNFYAEEFIPFVPILQKIQTKHGKYAVLGNHDYGDYYRWKSPLEKKRNHQLLLDQFDRAKIKLLNNAHDFLVKNSDTLFIAGIENWGKLPYREEGDLEEAIHGISPSKTVLLLSHDPIFWDLQVLKHPNIKVTFSGHTHGMQIGIRLFQKEYSPFAIGKKEWKGLYQKEDQYLYVNKGLSGSLYPGRVGIRPEITTYYLY